MYDNETFERHGHTFRVYFPYDDIGDTPWDRCDVHGVVSEWTTRAKRPGERVLCEDRKSRRYYDVQATMAIARRDWVANPRDGKKAAELVAEDFEHMRRWCSDEWSYVGVVVALLDDDGCPCVEDSLWGIESDAHDYLEKTAHEIADQILHSRNELPEQRRQAWRNALHEARERRYWAQRDVATA